MVLIDTSVWVRFLAKREPFFSEASAIMRNDDAAAHELVYGEILMGDTGGRRAFLTNYERMPITKRIVHEEVVTMVHARRLNGRGIGWIDVHLLASALAARMQFWTADARLAAIADELGVGYRLHHA